MLNLNGLNDIELPNAPFSNELMDSNSSLVSLKRIREVNIIYNVTDEGDDEDNEDDGLLHHRSPQISRLILTKKVYNQEQ